MRMCPIAFLLAIAVAGADSGAQTTQPAPAATDHAALELRATQAFNRGEYALALPMFEKVAEGLKDQPDRLEMVEEQIRACRKNLEEADPQAASTLRDDSSSAPPAITEEERTPHVRPPDGQILEITIKDLGNFEYDSENGGNVPADVTALSGARIRVRGFMIPMDQADRITQFALVPDLFACCFGQPLQIQHTVMVNAPPGKAVGYFPDEIVVEGTLNVEEKKEEGFVISLFDLAAASVKPAVK